MDFEEIMGEEVMERINASEHPGELKDAIIMLALFRNLPREARDMVIGLASAMVDQKAVEPSGHE